MAGVSSPRWDLAPTALALREGDGMFFQDYDPIPTVLAVKVQSQAIPRTGGHLAAGEGAWEWIS